MILPKILNQGCSLNYLHYGDSINIITDLIDRLALKEVWHKDILINHLRRYGACRKAKQLHHASDVIRMVGGESSMSLNIEDLKTALEQSRIWREHFKSLNCRGFSYFLSTNPNFKVDLKKYIDIRIALLMTPELYYPPKVRNGISEVALLSKSFAHVDNSICWALGRELLVDNTKYWFI